MNIHQLTTPALLVDLEVLERNLVFMQDRADDLKVALRPHIKTHKCIEIAKRQRELGARGISVSTFYEAEQFALAGFDDITWAFPIPLVYASKALGLCERATIRVTIDGLEACEYLQRMCAEEEKKVHVWLKVDAGYNRAGVAPHSPYAEKLVRTLNESKGLIFDGILAHSGSSYEARSRDQITPHADRERSVMVEFAEQMRAKGYLVPAISIGSTPAMHVVQNLDGITEVRPGNYIFHDYTQTAIGSCRPADCALSVLASVISHQPGAAHFLIDAGALALSKDAGPVYTKSDAGIGAIYEDYRAGSFRAGIGIKSLSQEIGKVVALDGASIEGCYRVGERMRVLPNHACLTTPNFDRYHVVRGDEVVDEWQILRGRA